MGISEQTVDVAVIGAGASGLLTALELARRGLSVLVLEARAEAGGRIRSQVMPSGTRMDLGAEFVHGHPPITLELLQHFGIPCHPYRGGFRTRTSRGWTEAPFFLNAFPEFLDRLQQLSEDISVEAFLSRYFPEERYSELLRSVQGFVEGYDTANRHKASMLLLRQEWLLEEQGESLIPEGGYSRLVRAMVQELETLGAVVRFGTPLQSLFWKTGEVNLCCAGHKQFKARKAVLTLPPPLWNLPSDRTGAWSLRPELPEMKEAMSRLGFGSVIKWVLHFSYPFWKTKADPAASFFLSREAVPTWWDASREDRALLVGWLGGPEAGAYESSSSEVLQEVALATLASLFEIPPAQLSDMLIEVRVQHWGSDPWSRGSYSYPVVQQTASMTLLRQPVEHTLFLGGEALYQGPYTATVEAALHRGREVASQLFESL